MEHLKILVVLAVVAVTARAGVISAPVVAARASVVSAPLVAAPYATSYTAHVAHHSLATPVASYVAAPAARLVSAPLAAPVAAPLAAHVSSPFLAPAVVSPFHVGPARLVL